ncbi:MAG TPA: cytochrome c oxidase assembly protein [Gaiellaceae bacterium]|nr:cytochrome c oxidase assembly protein [Gaiellaceae bacterium]
MSPAPSSFSFEPLYLALVVVAAVLYGRAARAERAPAWRVVLYSLGLLLVAGALNSPLETIAVNYLLLFHLLQNVMIADWAPPLLILGLTPEMRAAIARRGGRVFAALTDPKVALPMWLVSWYAIHLALLYDFALRHAWTLNIEHALLIAIGFLFWWPVLADEPREVGAPVKIGYLGAAFVGSVFLGLGLTFATTPFYDFYAQAPRLWGLSAEKDQNFGGILMNVEQSLVFLAAILYFVVKLIPEEERFRADA